MHDLFLAAGVETLRLARKLQSFAVREYYIQLDIKIVIQLPLTPSSMTVADGEIQVALLTVPTHEYNSFGPRLMW